MKYNFFSLRKFFYPILWKRDMMNLQSKSIISHSHFKMYTLLIMCMCFSLQNLQSQSVVTAINDGPWDSAATWDGQIPGSNDRVIISQGITVDITGDHVVDEVVVHGILNVPETGSQGGTSIGNVPAAGASFDGWNSNLMVNEADTYTNDSGANQTVSLDRFRFHARSNTSPLTPFVVRVNGNNDFTTLAVGTTRTGYDVGTNNFSFTDGLTSALVLAPGETIAVGFLDANADGSGSTDAAISWNNGGDEIWYTGGPNGTDSGSVSVGQAPTPGNSTINLFRQYQFSVDISTHEASSVIYEAEDYSTQSRTSFANSVPGFTGSGFIDYSTNASVQWNDVPGSGQSVLTFRYANGSGGNRTSQVRINGTTVATLDFPHTGSWSSWGTQTVTVNLSGSSDISLYAPGAGPNLDNMAVESTSNGFVYPETRSLTADWVHVNSGGVFQIGTASNRFDTGDFTLTLTGTNPLADHVIPLANGNNLNLNNNDGFLMAAGGGRLQFFGEERLSFTKLSQTAEAGSNTIVVENIIERNFDGTTSAGSDGALNWEVGDEIVVASSNFHYQEEDVRTITGIESLGSRTRLTLNSPLTHRHYGEIETYGQNLRAGSLPASNRPTSIDLRAEVALLSRNIVVKGLDSQDTDNSFGDRERLQIIPSGLPGVSLEGQSGSVQGIPRGYSSGELGYENVIRSNHFRVTGRTFVANGTTMTLRDTDALVRVHSTASGPAYLMYSSASVQLRFRGISWSSAHANVAVVRFRDGNWEAHQSETGNWRVFTPGGTDRLLAEVELNRDNEAGLPSNGIGGHIMIMNTAGQTTVDGAQLDQLGQAARLGRYPIHWHFGGDKNGDVLRNSSITNSNNRAVVVHGADNVLIQDVVAHDVHGHGFFLESGVERGNRFEANIALGIHRTGGNRNLTDPMIVDDADRFQDSGLRFRSTAAFWITGATNDFVGNIAAGAGGTAFWIAQPDNPVSTPDASLLTSDPYLGAMYQRDPDLEEMGIFESNTGHSMVTGLIVIPGGHSSFIASNAGQFRENVDYFNNVDPVFSNTTFYKTSTALYPLVTNVTLQIPNFRSADNEIALMDSDPMRIDGGLIVGDSRDNSQRRQGFRRANDGHRLLQIYHGYSVFEDVHIAGFANGSLFATDIGDRHRPDANFGGISWEDDGSHSQLLEGVGANRQYTQKTIYDRDGSLTSGIGGGAGWSIVTSFNNWIIDTNDGDKVFNTNGSYTGLTQKRVANMQLYPRHLSSYENARWRMTNSNGQVYEIGGNADERDTQILINRRPRLQLVLGEEYEVEFPRGVDFATEGVRFNLLQYSIPDGSQSVTLRFKGMANQMRPTFFETGEDVQRNSQLSFLRSATRTTYFPDPSSGDLYVKIFNRGVGVQSGYIEMVPINVGLKPEVESSEFGAIAIAPNPANEFIKLDLSHHMDRSLNFRIYSISGVLMTTGKFDNNHNESEVIDLNDLSNGTYILNMQSSNNVIQTYKIVVLK